jgi:Zn-dependent protease with chaperone function
MPAARFHDGRHGTTHIVHLLVFGRELRIIGQDDATLATWSLARMRAAPEADPDGVVTLTVRDAPGELLVDDTGDLDMLRHAGVRLSGHRAWSRRGWIAVCVGSIAVLGIGALALNTLPRWLAAAIPEAWERRLGDPAEALMTASSTRCTETAGQAALEHLVERLRQAGGITMPVTISVLDDRTVNAFTLPGGHILVMRGLIDEADDGPVLAGVIAHELGHVAHRDSTTLLLRSMGFSVVLHMMGLGDMGSAAANGASSLMSLAYGRAAETAADDTALALLTGAGLRADGLSRFFGHMMERDGAKDPDKRDVGKEPALNWLSTHPSSVERRARTARPATGEMPFTGAEWLAVRTMCVRK